MCQNLQRLQSSEENLFHICVSKKLLLRLLNTLHRNLSTHLWYSCALDYHTCHASRPPHYYKESQRQTCELAEKDDEILEVFPSHSSFPLLPWSLLVWSVARLAKRFHSNCFCFIMHSCSICIISLLILEVWMLSLADWRACLPGGGGGVCTAG